MQVCRQTGVPEFLPKTFSPVRAYPYEIPDEKQRRKKTPDADMTSQKEILETLSRLNSELVKDYRVQRIGLFGSYAR